jgi:hypothetical protein
MGLTCQKRTIWALLIGLSEYPQAPLRCPVADVGAMSKFLTEKLSVPQDHVTALVNPRRKTILSGLWSLHQDERIRYGDTIIVFYSGHGSTHSSGGVLRGGI